MPRQTLAPNPTDIITIDGHEDLQEGRIAAATIPIERHMPTSIALPTGISADAGQLGHALLEPTEKALVSAGGADAD
jgi:hypothetical protein